MTTVSFLRQLLFVVFMIASVAVTAQKTTTDKNFTTKNNNEMKTYLIERDIPGAGALTATDLKGISQKSCGVLKEMGPQIEWVHSYVTGNKIFCVYRAANEDLIRQHGKSGGFPVTKITEINTTISPATAE
jgi:hypothetical protein